MFFSPWLMVLAVLFVILLVLFTAFVIWLAHTLAGYPMFLIRKRDGLIRKQDGATVLTPRSLRIRPMPENAPALGTFAESSGMRARTMHDETMGHRTGRF